MIELLIKMADSLDSRGLYEEASKVDILIKKIAASLEYESNFTKECSNCASHADDEDSAYDEDDMIDNVEDISSHTKDYISIDDAYDKVIKKRKKRKGKRG